MNKDKEHRRDKILQYLDSVWHKLTYWQRLRILLLVWWNVFKARVRQVPLLARLSR